MPAVPSFALPLTAPAAALGPLLEIYLLSGSSPPQYVSDGAVTSSFFGTGMIQEGRRRDSDPSWKVLDDLGGGASTIQPPYPLAQTGAAAFPYSG